MSADITATFSIL